MLVLGFADYARQAHALAEALGVSFAEVQVHHFPDGESRIRVPPELPSDVVICRSLNRPNDKLVDLMLTARCARDNGASRLTLVTPYLCYMRQDIAFQPGEAISQRIVGHFLAGLFDAVVTVDPHLHRVHSLAEVVPANRADALSAAPAMGEFLKGRPNRPLLVGPDEESEQWVRSVAAIAGLDFVVARKVRLGDRSVTVELPARDYTGVDTVLVDDMASTGRTLAVTAGNLLELGASRVDVLVTHALFVGNSLSELRAAGVSQIWSSDSVAHETNAFFLASLLAANLH
jgi:ribose-phosphate pyrophosphokinase